MRAEFFLADGDTSISNTPRLRTGGGSCCLEEHSMDERHICRWLRRQFSHIGWVLVGYYLLLNVLVVAGVALDLTARALLAQGRPLSVADMEAAMGNAWGYIVSALVGVVVLYAWKGGEFVHGEIFRRHRAMTPAGFFGLVSLCVLAQMVCSVWSVLLEWILGGLGVSLGATQELASGGADTLSMFLYVGVVAPVFEELLFRGLVLRSFRDFGQRFAIFASAFLFGVYHGNLIQTPYAILMGLVLGYVTVEHSIAWAIALHMLNNLVLADLLPRMLSPLPQGLGDGIYGLIMFGLTLAAVAVLILRREEIREYYQTHWMDRRCLKCFFSNAGVWVLVGIGVAGMLSLLVL